MTIDTMRPDEDLRNGAPCVYEDPLDPDTESDLVVVTTRRSLIRLALAASETGSRFAREETVHDPVAWMLAPRRVFEGRSAIEACLARDDCMRAVLLHGLSMDLDADRDEMDDLIGEVGSASVGRDDDCGGLRMRMAPTVPLHHGELDGGDADGTCDASNFGLSGGRAVAERVSSHAKTAVVPSGHWLPA